MNKGFVNREDCTYDFLKNVAFLKFRSQKQPPEAFCKKRCSKKFRKIQFVN